MYTRNLAGKVSDEDLLARMNFLSKIFLNEDLSGDGIIDYKDFYFSKNKAIGSLKIKDDLIFADTIEVTELIEAYRAGDEEKITALLDQYFSGKISLFPDYLSDKQVRISLNVFGKGDVTSNFPGINYKDEKSKASVHSFYDKGDDFLILSATPDDRSKIFSWRGCDEISNDLASCKVKLNKNKDVFVNFSYKETTVSDRFFDLSQTRIEEENGVFHVRADHGDEASTEILANLKIGDFIAGYTDAGFLSKIVTIKKVSDFRYDLTTEFASLPEIVKQGTGILSRQLIYDDLIGDNTGNTNLRKPSALTPTSPTKYGSHLSGFDGIPGVTLQQPNQNSPNVFILRIGDGKNNIGNRQLQKISGKVEGTAILYTDLINGNELSAEGTVELAIDIDTALSYGFFDGLEHFKFVTYLDARQDVGFSYSGELETPKEKLRIRLGTLKFSSIKFFIGPVPIWVNPTIDVYIGANGKVTGVVSTSLKLNQTLTAGMVYNNISGFSGVGDANASTEFSAPSAAVEVQSKAYLSAETAMTIYGITGPFIPMSAYLKVKGEVTLKYWEEETCRTDLKFTAWAGLNTEFGWKIDADNRMFKLLGVEESPEIKVTLITIEKPLKKWTMIGECNNPAFLKVTGKDINEEIAEGSIGTFTTTYKLTNTGDEDLNWKASVREDADISISPSIGIIAKDDFIDVTVEIDATKFTVGIYNNEIKFQNMDETGAYDSAENGTTIRDARISVYPLEIAKPVLSAPTLLFPTIVKLDWEIDNPELLARLPVKRFTVYKSTDNVIWSAVGSLNDTDVRTLVVPHLFTNTLYYFKVTAYFDYNLTEDSQIVSIEIPAIEPTGNCRAHFSGTLMNDRVIPGWTSETYIVDQYSEYVGAGEYPRNTQAFPKAVNSTFDGIAIDKGTRVTIYAKESFGGDILYQKIGPAIVNNVLWQTTEQVSSVMGLWKEPLQTTYPVSVREWSASNMHEWSYGSLIVECGF